MSICGCLQNIFRAARRLRVRWGDERTFPSVRAADLDRVRYAAMFEELSPRVFAYARRQCDLVTAQDVVSETFLVAWRRRSDLPDSPLPWLLVIARNTIANRRRGENRRIRLVETVARLESVAGAAGVTGPADADILEREALFTAVADLSGLEREALLLVAWDGLTNHEASRVAGCSGRAFEVRLSRARARLSRALASSTTQTDAEANSRRRRGVLDDADLRKATKLT
jgi:RNA polymerase sigma factor (sigma-70 family)